MRNRFTNHLAVAVLLALAAALTPARAQVTSTSPTSQAPGSQAPGSQAPGSQAMAGWTFDVAPYFWTPTLRSNLQYTTPRGDVLTDHVAAGINDYLSDLNFATFLGGEARNGPVSIITDGMFTSLSLTGSVSHLSTLNLGPGPVAISRSQQLTTGTRTNLGVWSLYGGYTVASGAWGNLDLVGGLRMLGEGSRTNYSLVNDISLPNGTVALSKDGSVASAADFWQGVGGVRGRVNIPNSKFYVPFWLDVGDGGLFTWQAYAAIAYQLQWVDLSLGYRYLDFSQGGSKAVQNISMGGALLAANFHF